MGKFVEEKKGYERERGREENGRDSHPLCPIFQRSLQPDMPQRRSRIHYIFLH
jgi:hypothetical protein